MPLLTLKPEPKVSMCEHSENKVSKGEKSDAQHTCLSFPIDFPALSSCFSVSPEFPGSSFVHSQQVTWICTSEYIKGLKEGPL